MLRKLQDARTFVEFLGRSWRQSPEDAQDLAQAVLLKLLEADGDGVRIHTLDSWLWKVARNAHIDRLRRQSREKHLRETLTELSRLSPPQITWDEGSPRENLVAQLYYRWGYSTRELVALGFGSERATASLLCRFRRRFRPKNRAVAERGGM